VLDHEVGEPGAVDENYLLDHACGILDRSGGEAAGGDEDTVVGLLPGKCADKALESCFAVLSPSGLGQSSII
jgi:hypothetical protein